MKRSLAISIVALLALSSSANAHDIFRAVLLGRDDSQSPATYTLYAATQITMHNQEVIWLFDGIRADGLVPVIEMQTYSDPDEGWDDRWTKHKYALAGSTWYDNGIQNVVEGESTVYANTGTQGVRFIFLHSAEGSDPNHPTVDPADPDGDGSPGYDPYDPQEPYSPEDPEDPYYQGDPPDTPYSPPSFDTGYDCITDFLDDNFEHPIIAFFGTSFTGSPGISLSIPFQIPGQGTTSVQIESNLYEDSGPLSAVIQIRGLVYGICAALLTILFSVKIIRVVRQW